MWRFAIGCSLVMLGFAASAQAQSLAQKEAEIRAAVPYVSMLRDIPTLTWEEYEGAIRSVAQDLVRQPSPAAIPSSGTNSTSSRIGGTTFYNSEDPVTGTAQSGGSRSANETTTRIGHFQFHNFSNDVSDSSMQIGNSTFHNFSNGTNCTTTRIGTYEYTNCY